MRSLGEDSTFVVLDLMLGSTHGENRDDTDARDACSVPRGTQVPAFGAGGSAGGAGFAGETIIGGVNGLGTCGWLALVVAAADGGSAAMALQFRPTMDSDAPIARVPSSAERRRVRLRFVI